MASKKVKDLAAKVGTYQKDGETKNRYRNVGSLMKHEDGSFFILMDRTFNPAGVPGDNDRDNILISVFDLRDDSAAQPQSGPAPPAKREQRAAPKNDTAADFGNDDIPF